MGSVTSADGYPPPDYYPPNGGLDFYTNQTSDYDLVNVYDDVLSTVNGSANTTIILTEPPLGYSTFNIIIFSILLTFMMIVVVIGNMLVIIAIATEKTLKNIQNWFIASLAVADFFVGLVIMPFSLAYELMGYWIFGTVWCSIHSALDVLLCTSSIMNICLISLDRFWSITQAIEYLKKRTPARAAIMITMVWILSALISIPPLLGWTDRQPHVEGKAPSCELSKKIGYRLYSAMGSFYIPSCIMVFVYIRIYYAARDRARRGVRKAPRPKPQSSVIEAEESTTKFTTFPSTTTTTTATSASTSTTATTNFSERGRSSSSSPKILPQSAPPHLVTSPVELNAVPNNNQDDSVFLSTNETICGSSGEGDGSNFGFGSSSGNADTPIVTVNSPLLGTGNGTDNLSKTVKQVGFQVPLVSTSCDDLATSKPEIMVEGCSPEDSTEECGCSTSEVNGVNKEKLVQVTVEDVSRQEENETDQSSNCAEAGNSMTVNLNGKSQIKNGERTCKNNNTNVNNGGGSKKNSTQRSLSDPTNTYGCSGNVNANDSSCGSSKNNNDKVNESGKKCVHKEKKDKDKDSKVNPLKIDDGVEKVAHHSTLAVNELENTITELQSNGNNGNLAAQNIIQIQNQSQVEEIPIVATTSTTHHPHRHHHHHHHHHHNNEEVITATTTKKNKRPKLHFLRVEPPTIWRTSSSLSINGDVHILGTMSRSCSRLQLDADPVSDVDPSSSDSGAVSRCAVVKPLKLRLCQPFFGKKSNSTSSSSSGKARRDVLDMGKLNSPKEVRDPEREKRRIARKKEKRATLILGLIMGSFILCWLPFFIIYLTEPFWNVAPWAFAISFWLGYLNSALNPVIYTIFNRDFRTAFRKILFK